MISGSCHCGKCLCSAEEWYISGEFCDCDDRDCDKHDGLICTGAVLTDPNHAMSESAAETTLPQTAGQDGSPCSQDPLLIQSHYRRGGALIPKSRRIQKNEAKLCGCWETSQSNPSPLFTPMLFCMEKIKQWS